VIATIIWQKLSSIERKVTLIVRNFWQLFSQIFGETSLIVTNIWRNHTCVIKICNFTLLIQGSIEGLCNAHLPAILNAAEQRRTDCRALCRISPSPLLGN
jgi:hypothetical protein